MQNKQPLEVVPNNEGWSVQRQKADRALKNFETKNEAVDYAREMAKGEKGSLFIKDSEGQIQDTHDYSS